MAGQVLFYFRNPAFVDAIFDSEVRRDFDCESDAARIKLTELKARI
jgi:hypothetical protein